MMTTSNSISVKAPRQAGGLVLVIVGLQSPRVREAMEHSQQNQSDRKR